MKIIADLGKLDRNHNIIVISKADRLEFVVAENYTPDGPEGNKWDRGTYLYDLEVLAKEILYRTQTIGYDRMCEIASRAIDGLRENDEESAQEYCKDEIEMSYEEREFFGLEEVNNIE